MSFFNTPPRYQTFLLTLWEERNSDPNSSAVWRFRLEDPRSRQRQGFASLGELVTALEQKLVDRVGNGPDGGSNFTQVD